MKKNDGKKLTMKQSIENFTAPRPKEIKLIEKTINYIPSI